MKKPGTQSSAATLKKKEVEIPVAEQESSVRLELPALAVALLLDEWRRATMEGQGGAFVRLPRERYDGAGNLWSVVRRPGEERDKIVLVREGAHYQSRAAANEVARTEAELWRKRRALAQCSSSLEAALKFGDDLKEGQATETSEALRADIRALEASMAAAKQVAGEKLLEEWEFPLDLGGYGLWLRGATDSR